ncbi:Pregnancy-specific glycoprotein 22 [Lemmus lemmus]
MLLRSSKEGGHSLTHKTKLSDDHTRLTLVFLNSLLVSLLSSWHLSTNAHVTIEKVPTLVAEGDNVIFHVHDLPENITTLAWFKGLRNTTQGITAYAPLLNLSRPGPVYSGRETIYHNGSLLIENVNPMDTGFYTLRTYNTHGTRTSVTSTYLQVHAFIWKCGRLATSSQPTIESLPPSVAEGRNVLLLVRNPPENIVEFVWFKGVVDFKNILGIRNIADRKPTVWGPAYTGRERLYSDGSLLLHGVSQKDHGLYTLRILRADTGNEEALVQLQVETYLSVSCNPLTSSQLMIQPLPQYPAEGESIFLQVHNLPEDVNAFFWYKSKNRTPVLRIVEYVRTIDSITWGLAHKRRGMVYLNGSLMLQNVTEKDAGMYTLEVLDKNFDIQKAYVEFYLKKPVTQPFVQITNTTVTGRRSVIFSCISPDTDVSIRWIFNKENLQLTERMTLSPTKCGLRIDPVSSTDAGLYQCEVSNRFSSKISLPVSWP